MAPSGQLARARVFPSAGQVSGQPSGGGGGRPALGQRDAVRPPLPPARGFPVPGRRGPGAAVRKAQPGRVDAACEDRLRPPGLLQISFPSYDTFLTFPECGTLLRTTRPAETRPRTGPQARGGLGRLTPAAPGEARGILGVLARRPPAPASEGRPPKPLSFQRSLQCHRLQPLLLPGRLGL